MVGFTIKHPTKEQETLIADWGRENRLIAALQFPVNTANVTDMDSRRIKKITEREREGAEIRRAALIAEVVALEQRKS